MGIKKIAVATPYEDWVNDLEKKFFEESGVQVLHIQGLGLRGLDVCEVHPEEFYRFAKAQDREGADALFLSCMGLRTLEILSALEHELDKTILSSNQVTLWKLFRLCGIPGGDIGNNFGSLFDRC
jgi:maleate cis-trans isomerase